MNKFTLSLGLSVLPLAVFAQSTPNPAAAATPPVIAHVSVVAKGHDVRDTLSTIFLQAKQPYVIQPNVHAQVYLALTDIEFPKALGIICRQADLTYEINPDGIYYVFRPAPRPVKPIAPVVTKIAAKQSTTPVIKESVPARISTEVLGRQLTTRLTKVTLKEALAEIGRQTNVKIDVAPDVASIKLDAYMIKTSLKYALGKLTEATGCVYSLTESGSILVAKG